MTADEALTALKTLPFRLKDKHGCEWRLSLSWHGGGPMEPGIGWHYGYFMSGSSYILSVSPDLTEAVVNLQASLKRLETERGAGRTT